MIKLKKWIFLSGMTVLLLLAGCGNSTESDASKSEVEYLEGYDNLSEEETTKKLIMEADRMEVVPDNKE